MTNHRSDFQPIVDFVRSIYGEDFVPLHRPVFDGNEKRYLAECIDSNFVSSVGARVTEFEQKILQEKKKIRDIEQKLSKGMKNEKNDSGAPVEPPVRFGIKSSRGQFSVTISSRYS